jgi:Uma2 family endonuclease
VNVTDRTDDWRLNFRCPDVAVLLPGTRAIDRETHLLGGPDFVVEIASDYDRSREKFEFYAHVGVRELLLVDRNPWQLELYGLRDDQFQLVGSVALGDASAIASQVLPVSFRLLDSARGDRHQIEVTRLADGKR